MKIPKHRLLAGALGVALTAALLAGCGKKDDAITQAAKAPASAASAAASGPAAPSLNEIRAIAEEGFVYGLPIVMNYGVMYEYIIDKNSGQFKAPFNQIHNDHAASSLMRIRPSSRPTATRPIRCCGWTCAPNRWCCQCRRWTRTATTR
jgi:hypothetical protein